MSKKISEAVGSFRRCIKCNSKLVFCILTNMISMLKRHIRQYRKDGANALTERKKYLRSYESDMVGAFQTYFMVFGTIIIVNHHMLGKFTGSKILFPYYRIECDYGDSIHCCYEILPIQP